jgi:hypothetical protein
MKIMKLKLTACLFSASGAAFCLDMFMLRVVFGGHLFSLF